MQVWQTTRNNTAFRWAMICLVVCCFISLAHGAPRFLIHSWQTEDGLPQESVNAICQTSDGYLWLGTYDGLARFDGLRFVNFNTGIAPELKNSRITSLFEDSQHRLWIGHETGGITLLTNNHFSKIHYPLDLPESPIVSMAEDANTNVWVINAQGYLLCITGGPTLPPTHPMGHGTPFLVSDRNKSLWVIRDGALSRLEKNQLHPLPRGTMQGQAVHALCPSRDGGLWVLIGDQFRKYLNQKWTGDARPCPIPAKDVTSLIETAQERLAIGTSEDGLYLLPIKGAPIPVNRNDGLSQDWVRSLCQDAEGNLWVGTGNGGLNALFPSRIEQLAPADQWRNKAVMPITTTTSGLWVGTEGAGVYRYHQGLWYQYGEEEGLGNLFVWSIASDASNHIWAGTWGGGLYRFESNRFQQVESLAGLSIAAILPGKSNELWIGTSHGLIHYQNGQTNLYGANVKLYKPDVRALAQDSEGTLWFGMAGGGLGQLTANGNLAQYRKFDGLSGDSVNVIKTDIEGALWIGTEENGLCRLKQDHFVTIDMRNGLPDKTICAIENDGLGNFWISSHKGIFRVNKKELNRCADGAVRNVHCLLYGRMEGLSSLECSGGFQPAICREEDGKLLIPTRKGIAIISPSTVIYNAKAPSVVIEEVVLDGAAVHLSTPSSPLIIPPGYRQIEIRYTGISLSSPDKVRFNYRITPSQPDWLDAGNQRTITLSTLGPGNYTFDVIACNNDGVWNEQGASIQFIIQPYLWQTWWFRILATILILGIAGSGTWLITRHKMQLRMEILERQRAIERERARIARDIHDDLGATLTRITMLSDPTQPEPMSNVKTIYQTARSLTRTMDEIVWAVDPKHDSLDSLAMYLGKYAGDYLRPSGIRCRLELPVELPALPLRSEVRHNLFLALKEILNNITKHSKATEVHIALNLEPTQFTFSVQDNGCGFSGSTATQDGRISSGNGLTNIRRRMLDIGGQCEIASIPGAGVTVKLSYPIQKNKR